MIFGGLLTRIAITITMASVAAAGFLWWRIHEFQARAALAEQSLAAAVGANAAGQRAITALGREIESRDAMATAWMRRHATSERLIAESAARLEIIERENKDLHMYMDSAVPRLAADWLWMPTASGHQDGSGAGASASLAAGADTAPPIPVPHRDGWRWCRSLASALDSCNMDKTLLREWAAD